MSKNLKITIRCILPVFVICVGVITILASGGGEENQQPATIIGNWTWVSGDSTVDQPGFYGTKGVAAATNTPGGRRDSISWIDGKDNLWLFGGNGYYSKGDEGFLNDLWKFELGSE